MDGYIIMSSFSEFNRLSILIQHEMQMWNALENKEEDENRNERKMFILFHSELIKVFILLLQCGISLDQNVDERQ